MIENEDSVFVDSNESLDVRLPPCMQILNEDSVFVDSNESLDVKLPQCMQRDANQSWRDSLDFSSIFPTKANDMFLKLAKNATSF